VNPFWPEPNFTRALLVLWVVRSKYCWLLRNFDSKPTQPSIEGNRVAAISDVLRGELVV